MESRIFPSILCRVGSYLAMMVGGHLSYRTSQLSNLNFPFVISFETREQNLPLTWFQTFIGKMTFALVISTILCTYNAFQLRPPKLFMHFPHPKRWVLVRLRLAHGYKRISCRSETRTQNSRLSVPNTSQQTIYCFPDSLASIQILRSWQNILKTLPSRSNLPSTRDGMDLSLSEFENRTSSL